MAGYPISGYPTLIIIDIDTEYLARYQIFNSVLTQGYLL